MENIILWITLYGESRKLIKAKIEAVYGDKYTKEEIAKMSRLTYKDWGRFSRKLLTEIVSEKLFNEETGECLNIINAMRYNNILFMELLADRFDYMSQIEDFNKTLQREVTEITPDILEDLYVSPAVKRSIWQTIRIVEELKKIIGCVPAKIFVETTRSNTADKKPTDSRKKQLEAVYKNIKDKEIKELEKEINSTLDFSIKKDRLSVVEPSKLKAKKLYLYYTQLGRCMYSGESIDINELFDNNKYDIDHIYPQSKVKDDGFTNTVLVKKVSNAEKTDKYPLGLDIQTKENKRFWKFLKEKKLITEEKYNRLVRTEEFSDEELSGFIARQLVETSQSVKAVASVLGELNPESAICYSKAENVSAFRQNFGKIKDGNRKSKNTEQLIKVREINDFHHSKDAYLNVVVGNVFDVRFTRNAYNFIKDKKDGRKYSLNNMFYTDVRNSNIIAWEMDKTVHQVDKVMNNNNILVTRRIAEKKGELYNATRHKAKKVKKAKGVGYVPFKSSDNVLKNILEYGGFNSINIAYFSIVRYLLINKKGEINIIKIMPIPIYIENSLQSKEDLFNYIKRQLDDIENGKVKNIEIIYEKLREKTLLRLNDFKYISGGKSGSRIYCDSALQILLPEESEKYIKTIFKFKNWKNENKNGNLWENLSKEENYKLYSKLLEKLNSGIFLNKKSNKFVELNEETTRNKFKQLKEEDQIKVLIEILNLLTCKKQPGKDLDLIGITASRDLQNFDLSNLNQFSIIEQSVTGFYEKEITIIGEKVNDVENSNS